MIDKDLNDKLQQLGLTEYEIRAYASLLSSGKRTATELAHLSGVPRTKTYEVLAGLSAKGLCIEIPDAVRKYAAVEPEIAIKTLRLKFEEEFITKINLIDALKDNLEDMYSNRDTEEDNSSIIEVFRDKNTIWQKVQEHLSKAQEEIMVFSKEPYIVSVSHSEDSMKKINKDVKIYSIYEEKDFIKPEYYNGIVNFSSEGEEVRIIKNLPIKMTIIDSSIVILLVKQRANAADSLLCMIINQPDLSKTFKSIFNFFWKQGKKISHYTEKTKI